MSDQRTAFGRLYQVDQLLRAGFIVPAQARRALAGEKVSADGWHPNPNTEPREHLAWHRRNGWHERRR